MMFDAFFKSFGNGGFDISHMRGFDISHMPGFDKGGSVFVDPRTGQKIHVNINNLFNHHNNDENTYKKAKKDEPVFVNLHLSLEDLYNGVTKNMKISRKIHDRNRNMNRNETEILTIDVKPGWKEETKITFNNKGDVNPGSEPADMVFVIKHVY